MIQCDDCKGKGYKITFGAEKPCSTCKGEGELVVCDSFALAPGAVLAFRNQPCHNCGVRESYHTASEVKA